MDLLSTLHSAISEKFLDTSSHYSSFYCTYIRTCFRCSSSSTITTRRMVCTGNFGYSGAMISRFSDLISGKVGRQEIDEKTIGRG